MSKGIKKISPNLRLIILIGIVSFFADMTYESARSIIPQYFTYVLGGSVFALGIVIGIGDFLGYSFRSVSGKISDRTRNYWGMMFLGYTINLFAVPLLALANNYIIASILIIMERMGRATRIPPRDYVISTVASENRIGYSFALQNLLDQAGAVIGPLIISVMLFYNYGYRDAFLFLAIPATLSILSLYVSYKYSKKEINFEPRKKIERGIKKRHLMYYFIGIGLSAAGIFHISFILVLAQGFLEQYEVTLIFTLAMVGEGIFGFIFGIAYDKIGKEIIIIGPILAILIISMVSFHNILVFMLLGLLFGAFTGINDTVTRSVVASYIEEEHRGSVFGALNTSYGYGLLISSIFVGYFFNQILIIVLYIIILQISSIIILLKFFKKVNHEK
ncbi:MAG: MFS transporter [Thermoplasmata archaeon]|jgi:MFS family permease|nr:MFS transporter [Euryarchaeota archaeon]MVT35464.1 MFS transporter [Euryarchaeota archaeon]